MISDAAYRLVELYIHIMTEYLKNLKTIQDFMESGNTNLDYHIAMMQKIMRNTISRELEPAIHCFLEFSSVDAHMVIGTMLDPRFCNGQLFSRIFVAVGSGNDKQQKQRNAKKLMDRYRDEVLIPHALEVATFLRDEKERVLQQQFAIRVQQPDTSTDPVAEDA